MLEELVTVGRALPGEVKPVLADLQDVVAGIVHTLEQAHVLSPKQAQAIETDSETVGNLVADVAAGAASAAGAVTGTPEPTPVATAEVAGPETIGNLVADVAPGPAAADPLEAYTMQELADELARRQHAAIQTANEQRTQLGTG